MVTPGKIQGTGPQDREQPENQSKNKLDTVRSAQKPGSLKFTKVGELDEKYRVEGMSLSMRHTKAKCPFLVSSACFPSIPGVELRALLGKFSTTELHPSPGSDVLF